MKKVWIVLFSVFFAVGVFTSQAAAYTYVYGGDAPDSSLYFTDSSGNYITGIEGIEVGEEFTFDVWISDVPTTGGGLTEISWDLVFDPLVGFAGSEILTTLWGGEEPAAWYGAEWIDANHPGEGWGSQGLFMQDDTFGYFPITTDTALMRLTFECLGAGDTTILPMFHWADATFNMLENDMVNGYNDAADDTTWAFTYQDLLEAGSGYPTDIYDVSFGGLQISQQVPIPSAVLLLGSGLLGLFGIRRRSLP